MSDEDQRLRDFLSKKYGVDTTKSNDSLLKEEKKGARKERGFPIWLLIVLMFALTSTINLFLLGVGVAITAGYFFPFWLFRISAQFVKRKESYDKMIDNPLINFFIMLLLEGLIILTI